MRPRYLVAVTEDKARLAALKARLLATPAACEDGRILLERSGLILFVVGPGVSKLGEDGALIGSVFTRGAASGVTLDEGDQQAAVASRGASLIRRCWGGYVAVLSDAEAGSVDILRAPLGDLACYWTSIEGMMLFASDLSLMRAAGMPSPSIDGAALARHLAAEDIRRSETCLEQVRELPGGQRITVEGGRCKLDTLWSPWIFAAPERQLSDAEEAARRVRDAALHCVGARASAFNHVLLKLSGGLDSSIVFACLHHSKRPFTAVTLATHDPSGDERAHAGTVARSAGVHLVERYRDPSRVALERSAAARLPRPTARSFTQETARIAGEVASETGSEAIFDGGGGDNIFCSLQSARPAADCLMSEAGRGFFWRTTESIAQLAQTSLWAVARRAWMMKSRRFPDYRWPLEIRFLSAEARAELDGAANHPWLIAPTATLPGKAAHVALIAAAQSVAEGFDMEVALPTFSPLISQPLVEACLQVPSWLWFEAGRNRATARRAFAGRLPDATLQRRSKGAPDCFIADLFEANRPTIRAMLTRGALSDLGLLDMETLSQALDDRAPVRGHDFLRIMQLADAEAWARCWS
jgi:asparagine synthase (glutamine-hydrolysing)